MLIPIVDMTQFFPYTWILHLIRALIAYNITSSLLKKRLNMFNSILINVGVPLIYSYVTIQILSPLENRTLEFCISIIYYGILFLVIQVTFKGSVWEKLITIILCYIGYMICALITCFMFSLVPGVPRNVMYMTKISLPLFIGETVTMYFISFALVYMLQYFLSKRKKTESSVKNLLFYLIPVSHVLCAFLAYIMTTTLELNNLTTQGNYQNIVIFSQVLLSACFIFDFFFVEYLKSIDEKGKINDQLSKANQIYYDSLQLLKKKQDSLDKLKHDALNINSTVVGFLELGNTEKALELLNKSSNNMLEFSSCNISPNSTINIVVAIKLDCAKKKSIKLNVTYDGADELLIADYDLCRLVSNLIDNSLNATELAGGKECFVKFSSYDNTFNITTKNPYAEAKGLSVSGHGYGTKIIKDIANKYKGKYTQEKSDNEFYTLTILQNKKVTD